MSPGADLFVVCKQCGAEVSPYITECPYCGTRLRRRAPRLPREGGPTPPGRRRAPVALSRLRAGEIPGIRPDSPPYATAALVLGSIGVWIAWRGGFVSFYDLIVDGPLGGHGWRLVTSQFAYASGLYQFATLVAVALFGWLLERRHGHVLVIVLFLAGGVGGALVDVAIHQAPLVSGGNGGALALLCTWAAPDLRAARRRMHYESDLLGTAFFAAVLLAMPLARVEASWAEGVVGSLVGLAAGPGLARLHTD